MVYTPIKEDDYMPFIAPTFTLPDDIRKVFNKYSRSSTLPSSHVQRARIILMAADGKSNLQISKQTGISNVTVGKWRRRIIEALPYLQDVLEKDPSKLGSEIATFLADRPRSGAPRTYTDDQVIRIIEMACRNPQEYGYETSHWSLSQLCAAAVAEGIVDSISAKTVSRFLKYGGNPPPSRPVLAAFL